MYRSLCSSMVLALVVSSASIARAGDPTAGGPTAGGPVDLLQVLTTNAEQRAFFTATDGSVVYRTDRVEYWDAGFDGGGLTDKYPADRWAAFELGELKMGMTRIVAMIELDATGTELIEVLEMGDVLQLNMTFKDRLAYEWTDAVLGDVKERELVLMQVETLSYALPRLDGYYTLWYDRTNPSRVKQRTHLQQDGLAKISVAADPGSSHTLNLAPGSYMLFFYPEIDAGALPITIEAPGGTLVFGVLSGEMGLQVVESGARPPEDDVGQSILELTLPDDVAGKSLWLVRDQRDASYFLLLVPQDSQTTVKGKLKIGQP